MRKRDKLKVITEANKRLEASWVTKKVVKENHETTNIDTLIHNDKVQELAQDLANDPEKLKKAIGELESMGISKDTLSTAINTLKSGKSVDGIIKSAVGSVTENITEVTEIEDDPYDKWMKSRKEDDEKRWITGQGGVKDAIGGAKIGGVIGLIGASALDAGLLHIGADPQNTLIAALAVILTAAASGAVFAYKK